VYHLDDPTYRVEYFVDAWSSFIKKNSSYQTHTLVDINEIMSDIISIMHLSLNMPDMPKINLSDLSPVDSSTSPRRRSKARKTEINFMMSPIIYGVGGEIEKFYYCPHCKQHTLKLENFISLNFKKLTLPEMVQIREKFHNEGYEEGIKFEDQVHKSTSMLQRLFKKKKQPPKPIATIRDYLCHLNLLQKDVVVYE
jgi:hypothetical protein